MTAPKFTLTQNNPFNGTGIIGRGKHPTSSVFSNEEFASKHQSQTEDMEIAMTSKTKSGLVAVLIAAFATPALAAPLDHGDYTQSQRVIEGRNAAMVHDFDTFNGTSSGRDSLVQSLGN